MLLPQRKSFVSRDDFAAAVSASFGELWEMYEGEPVRHIEPEWTLSPTAFNVALPIDVARNGGDAHGVASIVKHMVERKRSIRRIARVERDRKWFVWIDTVDAATH